MENKEWDIEESFHAKQDRKTYKKERKIASKLDRSKYKKTDLDKSSPKNLTSTENQLKGLVLSIISQDIVVDSQGKIFHCTLRGTLKQELHRLKNLITVGDIVYFDEISKECGVIHRIEERKSLLSRKDHGHTRNRQLLAANIDQVLITVSAAYPELKPALIDRYIIASEKGNMKPIILINKIDLLEEEKFKEARPLFELTLKTYQDLGFVVIALSSKTLEGIDQLKEVMKDKISVFSGQSGTGKSSLINLVTGLDLVVGDLTKKTLKGGHTTTSAKLIGLTFGGFCIDTPGIRSFGVWGLEKEEVKEYFEEFITYRFDCKYPNCTHLFEPECAVRQAVALNQISPLRYESYQKLCHEEKWEE